MSKERARRRSTREREAAIKRAARAAEHERRERRVARSRRFRAATSRHLGRRHVGRAGGVLARRRRRQTSMLVAGLLCLNVLLWVLRPDWEARLAGVVVTVLAFPVLRLLLFPRR